MKTAFAPGCSHMSNSNDLCNIGERADFSSVPLCPWETLLKVAAGWIVDIMAGGLCWTMRT